MRTIISNLNLSEAEAILTTCYKYTPGKPGRPSLLPSGMFYFICSHVNVKLIWHFLKFNKEVVSLRTSEELKKLKKDTIRLIDEIENAKKFPANPSRLCS